MALATRPKPTVHHKKRQAGHHRHSKHYLRPYWPYLPMLAIIGAGAYVNKLWAGSLPGGPAGRLALNSQLAAVQPVTRVQVLTNDRSGLILVLVIIATAVAFAVFTWRHWRRLHRLVNKGEAFVSHHPWLDVATVFVFTAGFVLTRPNGFIS
jgi:hypothetical protein